MIHFNIEESIVEKRRGPDLMPLIDMVFILLVFFLLTSTAAIPSVDVELPETASGETRIPPSIVVTIKADGTLLVDEEQVTMDLLLPLLASRYRDHLKAELTIRADRRVAFGKVVEIMDLCKRAGAEEVSFLVEVEEGEK